jgi:hypothetical protein
LLLDTRTVINEGDNATGWNTGAAITSFFAESTACIAVGDYGQNIQIYHTGTARSAADILIYVYAFNNGLQHSWLQGGGIVPVGLHIGDGTNRVTFRMAGDDKKVFVHSDGPTAWQNLVVDTSVASQMNTDGLVVVRAGSFAALNFNSLTQFGGDYYSISKALGGGYNQATDIIRIGNDGLVVTGGLTGDRGTFLEIVVEDRSTANLKAHGLIREYSTNFYGLQGPLTFGSATGTVWFDDQDATLIFENRNIANDKYYIKVVGGTGSTNFFLRNSTITTAGPYVTCDFSSGNINQLEIRSVNFTNTGNAITFAVDVAAQNHIVNLCNFTSCGQINPGVVQFTNAVISDSMSSATGALILDRVDANNLSNINFNSDGSGHAIYITQAGDYNFNNFTYNGYGANGTTDAMVYNNSGGVVNVYLNGGTAPTVRNGAGSTTNIIVTATLTLTQLPETTLVTIVETANRNNVLFQTNVGATGQVQYVYGGSEVGLHVDIMFMNPNYDPNIGNLFDFELPSNDTTLPISLIIDRTYIE